MEAPRKFFSRKLNIHSAPIKNTVQCYGDSSRFPHVPLIKGKEWISRTVVIRNITGSYQTSEKIEHFLCGVYITAARRGLV